MQLLVRNLSNQGIPFFEVDVESARALRQQRGESGVEVERPDFALGRNERARHIVEKEHGQRVEVQHAVDRDANDLRELTPVTHGSTLIDELAQNSLRVVLLPEEDPVDAREDLTPASKGYDPRNRDGDEQNLTGRRHDLRDRIVAPTVQRQREKQRRDRGDGYDRVPCQRILERASDDHSYIERAAH
ncbi:MAG TPA: hypothetical protein VFU02_06995, partial [Polyangiaceae bacterium]|nr:hypothetical protein [Polyangiaceae bacterium]